MLDASLHMLKLFLLIWLQLPLGPAMGANVVYKFLLQPIFRCIGPVIKRFRAKNADEMYEIKGDMASSMSELQNAAMQAGTSVFLERAMNKMTEEYQAAETADTDE